MNLQEIYQVVIDLHKQGLGATKIHRRFPEVGRGRIAGWIYHLAKCPPDSSSFHKRLSKTKEMSREEIYPLVLKLHEKGLGYHRIHKLIPQIPLSTIGRWIYTDDTPDYSKNHPNLSESPALAYIFGVLYGDGYTCIHKSQYNVGLRVKDKEFADAFCGAMNRVNLYPGIWFQEGKYYRAVVGSKIFVRWFRRLHLKDIENLSSGYEVDFIRGFYDSEGSLSPRSRGKTFQITMSNTNLELVQLVQKIMAKLGFVVHIDRVHTHSMKINKWKAIYHLRLCGGQQKVTSFCELIKPSIPRKGMERIKNEA